MTTTIDFHYVYYTGEPTRENWNSLDRGVSSVLNFEMDEHTAVAHLQNEIARMESANPHKTEMWKVRDLLLTQTPLPMPSL